MYFGNQIQRINQNTLEIKPVYEFYKEYFDNEKIIDNNFFYVLKENNLLKVDLEGNTQEDFDISKEIVDLSTYEILKIKENSVYFFNVYGKMATFNLKTKELIILPHITKLSEDHTISSFVNDENAYFMSYTCLFRFNFNTLEVTEFPVIDLNSGLLMNFAIEPTEQFMILIKDHSSGNVINKVYLDEMKLIYVSGYINNENNFSIY